MIQYKLQKSSKPSNCNKRVWKCETLKIPIPTLWSRNQYFKGVLLPSCLELPLDCHFTDLSIGVVLKSAFYGLNSNIELRSGIILNSHHLWSNICATCGKTPIKSGGFGISFHVQIISWVLSQFWEDLLMLLLLWSGREVLCVHWFQDDTSISSQTPVQYLLTKVGHPQHQLDTTVVRHCKLQKRNWNLSCAKADTTT